MTEHEKKLEELQKAYTQLFNTDYGKMVLDDLKKFCGYEHTSVCEQSPDPYQTFFAEGKRRVYLRILSLRSNDDSDT